MGELQILIGKNIIKITFIYIIVLQNLYKDNLWGILVCKVPYRISKNSWRSLVNSVKNLAVKNEALVSTRKHLEENIFSFIYFWCIFCIFYASAAPQRLTCSCNANPVGYPRRNWHAPAVWGMPDSNPGALPMNHHTPAMSNHTP